MSSFSHTIEIPDVESPVTEALGEIFSANTRALQKIVKEHKKLQDQVAALTRERNAITQEADRIREENMRLKTVLRGSGAAVEAERPYVLEKELKLHSAPVHCVATKNTPSSCLMASGSWDASVNIYDLVRNTSQRLNDPRNAPAPSEQRMGGVYSVAFGKTQAASHILGCASCDRSVYIWNYQTGEQLKRLQGHTNEVNDIDFHNFQQVICTASDDFSALIWDYKEGAKLRMLEAHTAAVYGATFLGEDHEYLVATCCFDKKIRLFDMRDKSVVKTLEGHGDDIIGIDYNSSVRSIATGSDDGMIMTWDSRKSWRCSSKLNTKDEDFPENEVKRVAFSPDGSELAAACSSGQVLIYDYHSGEMTARLPNHWDCVFDVAWTTLPSGRKVITTASHDHLTRIWMERQ